MTTASRQAISELQPEFGFDRVCLTNNGQDLLTLNPAALGACLASARRLVNREAGWRTDFQWLGGGRLGHVYAVPDHDDLCLKIASSDTLYENRLTGRNASAPSMQTEMRFMDLVQKRLNRRSDYGVMAPRQYGLVGFRRGEALIEERIPPVFVTIGSLLAIDAGLDEQARIVAQGVLAVQRTRQALGLSCLRLGGRDLTGDRDFNRGNFMVQPDKLTESNFYALDLVGNTHVKRALARLAVLTDRVAGSLPSLSPAGQRELTV